MADIGATYTRCALLDDDANTRAPEKFSNARFSGIEDVLGAYLDRRRDLGRPRRAALAVAAPVLGDDLEMLNRGWRFSRTGLQESLELRELHIVNDFAAVALGLPALAASDYTQIGGGQAAAGAPLVVLGPGSGLGVASLVPSSDGWTAVAGEGGHVTLAAATSDEAAAIERIRDATGHCSAERVLSGPGLARLHATLAELAGRTVPPVSAADVTKLARAGDPLAGDTLGMFLAFLGTVAADLVLTLGARGGVYVAGGIVPRLVDLVAASGFRKRFLAKGRYRDYLASVPTRVITEPVPAFGGLRQLLGERQEPGAQAPGSRT